MDRYLEHKIANITDDDLWSSIRRRSTPCTSVLEAANAKNRDLAYRRWGQHHATALVAERHALESDTAILSKTTEQAQAIEEQAKRVLRHDIQGWHNQSIQFGQRIDFNADFGRSGQYGFHYLTWLMPVIHQYVLTRDPAYRDCVLDIIRQYYEQRNDIAWRIPHLHPVYYELGARGKTNVLLPAYALFADDEAVDTEVREAIVKLLVGFARSLFRIQRTGYRSGNWQLVGCTSLFRIGCALSELKESAQWRARASELLDEHRRRGFFADGGHCERCWDYGYMSLDGMRLYYRMALASGYLQGSQRAQWTRFMKRAYRWFAESTTPNLYELNYGDGCLRQIQHVIDDAHALFPEWRQEPNLFGVDRTQSALLKPSGYAFMRGRGDADASFLSINFGKWGGSHTHDDLLDFSIWRYGEPLIEEVGRFGSYDNPLEPLFRCAESHNQVVLAHRPMNRRLHEGQDIAWYSDTELDVFSAWHEAFEPTRIYRQIVFLKAVDAWLIYDVVQAQEYIFQVDNYFHSPREFKSLGHGKARLTGSPSCLVTALQTEDLRRMQTGLDYAKGDMAPPSAIHGFADERHHLVMSKWHGVSGKRPITFATLLQPFRGQKLPSATAKQVEVPGDNHGLAAAFELTIADTEVLIVCNPGRAALRYGGRALNGPLAIRRKRRWIEL